MTFKNRRFASISNSEIKSKFKDKSIYPEIYDKYTTTYPRKKYERFISFNVVKKDDMTYKEADLRHLSRVILETLLCDVTRYNKVELEIWNTNNPEKLVFPLCDRYMFDVARVYEGHLMHPYPYCKVKLIGEPVEMKLTILRR